MTLLGLADLIGAALIQQFSNSAAQRFVEHLPKIFLYYDRKET
jgi:hypothetical protein